MLASQFDECWIDSFLYFIELAIRDLSGVGYFVALQFDVIIVSPNVVEPLDSLLRSLNVSTQNFLGNLATYAGRANDEAFVELFQVFMICARSHIEAIYPRARNEFDEVVIANKVLGKNNEVPARLVFFSLFYALVSTPGHIHFAAEDRLEGFLSLLYSRFIDLLAVVVQLFDAEHISVVGKSHTTHAVANSFVHHALDRCLSVEQ